MHEMKKEIERQYFIGILETIAKAHAEENRRLLDVALGMLEAFAFAYGISFRKIAMMEYWELKSYIALCNELSLKDFNEEVYAA